MTAPEASTTVEVLANPCRVQATFAAVAAACATASVSVATAVVGGSARTFSVAPNARMDRSTAIVLFTTPPSCLAPRSDAPAARTCASDPARSLCEVAHRSPGGATGALREGASTLLAALQARSGFRVRKLGRRHGARPYGRVARKKDPSACR